MQNKIPEAHLNQLFWQKVDQVWQTHFNDYGNSYDDLFYGRKMDFYKAFRGYLKVEGLVDFSKADFSVATVRTIFQTKRISSSQKIKTLDVLSRYVGYMDWDDLKAKINAETKQISKPSRKSPTDNPPSVQPQPPGSDRPLSQVYFFVIGSAILIAIIAIYALWGTRGSATRSEPSSLLMDTLKQVINGANTVEYNAYTLMPKFDTTDFSLYYTENGMIAPIRYLESIKENERCLMDGSHYNVISIDTLNALHNGKMEVKSREYWFLQWCGANKVPESLYDVENNQTYIFVRENGRWKIDANIYDGKARKPTLPDVKCDCGFTK
jgi:hypothetical protein